MMMLLLTLKIVRYDFSLFPCTYPHLAIAEAKLGELTNKAIVIHPLWKFNYYAVLSCRCLHCLRLFKRFCNVTFLAFSSGREGQGLDWIVT